MRSAAYILRHVTSNSISKLSSGRERKKGVNKHHMQLQGEKKERNSVKFYIPEKETVAKKKNKRVIIVSF